VRRLVLAAVALAVLAPDAAAAPDCDPPATPTPLLTGQGTLESVIVDPRGPLYFTNEKSLLRLDRPGGEARVVAEIEEPGGLAFDLAGNIVVGSGNSLQNGSVGDATGPAKLVRVDPQTGAVQEYATGLSMANGLVRGAGDTFYASNDGGANIDRIVEGQTQRGWARVQSGNGLAIDSGGRWLYVAQTFQPAAIQQVDLTDPGKVTPFVEAGPDDVQAGLDGMTRDAADRLLVTANGSGQVWRIEGAPPEICVLVRGLPGFPDGPSAVAVGRPGTPFAPENAYVVAFNGTLLELAGVATPPSGGGSGGGGAGGGATGGSGGGGAGGAGGGGVGAGGPSARRLPVRLRVTPKVAIAGRRTRLRVVVEVFRGHGWQRAARARVRFLGRTLRVRRNGVLRFTHRFRRPGRYRLRATFRGARSPAVTLRVFVR
jgi:gluconolactonase